MSEKPVLALDTSALNRLAKDSDSEPFIAAILSGYSICLLEMSFEEALATPDVNIRKKLVSVCSRLLGVGYCILPAHWLFDMHIKTFHHNPTSYEWRKVAVRANFIEEEIQRGECAADEKLVEQQAIELRRLQDEFETAFKKSTATNRPSTFNEWLVQSRVDGGSFWNSARGLYEHAFGEHSAIDASAILINPPDEATLKSFLGACPPVRAMVYAFELVHYDRSLRLDNRLSFKAGRNDQMMAVFLPYCDQFLTNDGQQERCLREVASCADIPVRVRSYDDFCSSLLVS